MATYTGYLGTYTKKDSQGVYRFKLDTDRKEIMDVEPVAALDNPTYLAISRDNQYLYAVAKEGDKGGVTAFRLENNHESLEKVNSQATDGSHPCHLGIRSDNKLIAAANYHTKMVEAFKVNQDGSLEAPVSREHEGNGPHERQEKPHLHYADFTPDEKYIIVVDLGSDTITTYQPYEDRLEEIFVLKTKPGSGPRHLTFHPNGKYAYVMTELSNEVIVLEYNEKAGTFKEVQYVSALPDDFQENSQGSAIKISSDGKFVYAGNRGHDSIAVYQVRDDYTIELVEWTHTEGHWPRDFELDPSEQFIVASNQETGTLALFERDEESGRLSLLQKDIKAPEAICVKFLHY